MYHTNCTHPLNSLRLQGRQPQLRVEEREVARPAHSAEETGYYCTGANRYLHRGARVSQHSYRLL